MTEIERRKVAIVNDDFLYQVRCGCCWKAIGCPVETFASGAEFLNADKRHLVCLILDHHLPGMTGLELATRSRSDG